MKKSILAVAVTLFSFGAYAAGISDAHITEIMKEANEAEVDAGKLAKSKAQNGAVKSYAEKMITAHKDNEKAVKDVSKKQKIKMDSSDMSKKIEKDGEDKISELKKKDKADFDRAYIASQIEMHETLLADLSNTYIPSAQNVELKKYLEETKQHVSAHLEEAKTIQANLR